jgi:hypothetical protein
VRLNFLYLQLRNWLWIKTKPSVCLYEKALEMTAADPKDPLRSRLAKELVTAGSMKMVLWRKNAKRWCKENNLDSSEWRGVRSDTEAASLLHAEAAKRFVTRRAVSHLLSVRWFNRSLKLPVGVGRDAVSKRYDRSFHEEVSAK